MFWLIFSAGIFVFIMGRVYYYNHQTMKDLERRRINHILDTPVEELADEINAKTSSPLSSSLSPTSLEAERTWYEFDREMKLEQERKKRELEKETRIHQVAKSFSHLDVCCARVIAELYVNGPVKTKGAYDVPPPNPDVTCGWCDSEMYIHWKGVGESRKVPTGEGYFYKVRDYKINNVQYTREEKQIRACGGDGPLERAFGMVLLEDEEKKGPLTKIAEEYHTHLRTGTYCD